MRLRAILFGVLLFGCAISMQARSLYWREIGVDAQLDRNGALTVAETQTFVFDGDWNGGERTFSIREGQHFELLGLERLEGPETVPLFMGDLSGVDQYQLVNRVLRWRSRLPEDPPFENKAITYRIRYRLGGILVGREGTYRLNHDFLFPDRAGVVQAFSLRLTVDPVWSGIESPLTRSASNLVPGEGFIVTQDLRWTGGGAPASVVQTGPAWHGQLVVALLIGGLVLLFAAFFFHEYRRGRFAPLVPVRDIDDGWLQEHLFQFSPEAVGAAWDGKVGAHEVAAALATLVQRGVISSTVEKKRFFGAKLTMRLLVPHSPVDGHYGTLVDKLFFGGRTTTDSDLIQSHYRSTGLDLAAVVKPRIDRELSRVAGWNEKTSRLQQWVAVGPLLLAIVLLVAVQVRKDGADDSLVFGSYFFGFLAITFGGIFASVNRNAMGFFLPRLALVLLPTVPLIAARINYLWHGSELLFSLEAMLVSAFFALAVVHTLLSILRTSDTPEKLEFRRLLRSARRYMQVQLRTADPRLRDEWFPYLLAFGLGSNVDRWFRRFDPAGRSAGVRSTSSSFGSSSSSTSSSSWTGGGGAFGGAGASGSWVMAAAGVASGVSKPGSGGGGGGGSSSGGGGGGGW